MTDRDIIIEPAGAADIAAIVRMMSELSRQEGDPDDLFDEPTAMADLLGDVRWINGLVAKAGDRAVGVALWHPAYETSFAARGGFITSLWVEPDHRRQGIATRLIAAVAGEVDKIGGAFVWWASKPFNTGAHATYASVAAKQESVMAHALTGERFRAMVRRAREDQ